jgi:hypothetical protein
MQKQQDNDLLVYVHKEFIILGDLVWPTTLESNFLPLQVQLCTPK